jgi:hypothetical protein
VTKAFSRVDSAGPLSPEGNVANSPASHWLRGFAVLVFSVTVTLVLLNTEVLPLGAVRAEDLAKDYGLLTWNFWAVTESVLRGENPYETDLLFHPIGANLAAHTLGPGFLPIGLTAKVARGGALDYPLFARRTSVLVCFTLGVFLAYYAFRALGSGDLPAIAAAVGWAFAACWHLIVVNPPLASACFLIPAVALAGLRLLDRPSTGRAVTLAVVVSGSVYFSEYYSAFIALAVVLLVFCGLAFADTRVELRAHARAVGARGLGLAPAVGVLLALPFLVNWMGSEGRPPRERQLVVGGANLAGYVLPSPTSTPLYAGETTSRLHAHVARGHAPFIGIPTALLAVIGISTTEARRRRPLLVLAVTFFVLSLGPVLKVLGTNTGVPLPYTLLKHVPPFQMARDPQRLSVLGIWALVCLAALGLTALGNRLSRRVHPFVGAAVGILALAWWLGEGYRPGLRPVVFTPPAELTRPMPGAVANLPLHNTDGLAMFLQIFHGRPIITGYVSRTSERQFAHVSRLQRLLESDPRAFVRALRGLGVDTLILEPGTPEATAEVLSDTGLFTIDLRAGLPLSDALPDGRRSSSPRP